MNHDIEITQLDLVKGGNVIRQGHHFTLDFIPRGENGDVVALVGKDVYAVFYDKNGIRYEGAASYVSSDAVIRVSITENIGHGTMWIEFTATDPNDATYKKKFPARENNARISVTPSTDDLSFVGVKSITVEQLRNEQTVAQQDFEAAVIPRVKTVEGKAVELEQRVNDGIGAFTEDTEIIDARGGEANLRVRLDKTTSQLADKVEKDAPGAITYAMAAQDFREQITGGNTAVVGVDAVLKENIVDGAVSAEKTDFVQKSPNMFDKANVFNDVYISSGVETTHTSWASSGFIPIKVGQVYKKSHISTHAQYDQNKTLLSSSGANDQSFTAVSNAVFVRVSVRKSDLEIYQLEKGSVSTPYQKYGVLKSINLAVGQTNLDSVLNTKVEDLVEHAAVTNELLNPVNTDYPLEIFNILENSDSVTGTGGQVRKDQSKMMGKNRFGWKNEGTIAGITEIVSEFSVPKEKVGVGVISAFVYIEDVTKIDSVAISIGTDLTGYNWTRDQLSLPRPLKNGMNLLRWRADSGIINDWQYFRRVRVRVTTNAKTNWTVAGVFGEVSKKAQLLFVEDGGYIEFLQLGYPALKARNIPTTWALNPGRLGEGRIITETDIDNLALDFMSSFSFHSWSSEVHADMPYEEVRNNAIKCIRWIQKKGIQPKYWFRAAITQNSAVNHAALQDIIEAYSSPTGGAAFAVFPFIDPYGVPRVTLHGKTPAEMDAIFDTMKKTHNLMIGYTHGISDNPVPDMSFAEWDYFMQKIDQAQAEGWLEGVTYDMLRIRHERQFGGAGFDHLLNAFRN